MNSERCYYLANSLFPTEIICSFQHCFSKVDVPYQQSSALKSIPRMLVIYYINSFRRCIRVTISVFHRNGKGYVCVREGILHFSFYCKKPRENQSDRNNKEVANLEFFSQPFHWYQGDLARFFLSLGLFPHLQK